MNKRILFFAGLTLILFLVVVGSMLFAPQDSSQTEPLSIPIFGGTPAPSANNQTPGLRIIKVTPPYNTDVQNFPTAQIQIEFSQAVDMSTLKYTVSPETKTFVKPGSNENILILSPDPSWTDGITTINISEPVSGEYRIKTGLPELPPPGSDPF